MIDEGAIKYRCNWENAPAVRPHEVVELTRYRDALYQLNFIGQYPNGIGFGNISHRVPTPASSPTPHFIISGTQTAHLSTLTAAEYARVTSFDPAQNTLTCQGLCKASSESLTHGVVYAQASTAQASTGLESTAQTSTINAIIHIHHQPLWKQLLYKVPTTHVAVPYGTPEMAAETQRLFRETDLLESKVFAMAGHEEGIVAFGATLSEAYRMLIDLAIAAQIIPSTALQLPEQI